MKALVIGGTQSGSGKTSVALGLAAVLRRRGLNVQAFKIGPDFLDPTYLEIVTGRPAYNLDHWMTGAEYVRELFIKAASGYGGKPPADVCIIEGVMGLYDGIFTGSDFSSTASVAKLLDVPVFLLSSCKAMARSFAALVSGFCNFPDAPRFGAIGANMAGSERHGDIIRAAVQSVDSLPPFAGALVRGSIPALESRHLGLVSADTELLSAEVIGELADGIEKSFDIDLLLAGAAEFSLDIEGNKQSKDSSDITDILRIGIADDKAFHFYYPDNLAALEEAGCELIRFSPLADEVLPCDIDALYFGGGYPECNAAELSANSSMLESIREFADSGQVIYAECGGLMYMSQGIVALDGEEYPMCGVLPVRVEMLERFKTLGYVEAEFSEENIFGDKGGRLRGHEYHYSRIVNELSVEWQKVYKLRFGRDMEAKPRYEGYAKDGVLVSYLHANFAANSKALESLLDSVRKRTVRKTYEV